ncbi:E3 ubiquitin-protein ligase CHFR [Neosynchiropus ocellatus]
MAVHQHSPSNLTELERIRKEERQRIPKSRTLGSWMEDRRAPLGMLRRVDGQGCGLVCFRGECTVGRKSGCTLQLSGNKLVSGKHCTIMTDSSGTAWLEDTSTHGTVVNRNVLVKRRVHMIRDGDVLYFSYRPKKPEQNSSFVYYSVKNDDAAPESNDMALSVEPLLLPNAPLDLTEKHPQLSNTFSHLCIQRHTGSHQMASSVEYDSSLLMTEMAKTENVQRKRKKKKKDKKRKAKTKQPLHDAMKETLTCVICQDLVNDCVSLQPCMHIFCASCCSGWMLQSSLCPICRCHVESVNKNHILNNLVEAYLMQHPEKRQEEEGHRNMGAEMATLPVTEQHPEEYINLVSSENDSDDGIYFLTELCQRGDPSLRWHLSWPDHLPPFRSISRSRQQPSSAAPRANSANGCHLQCHCCGELMQDRRMDAEREPSLAQICVRCQQPFCHLYLGCWTDCGGCLGPFTELDLGDNCLQKILNDNEYESEILQNYLSSRSMTWRDMVREACRDVRQGKYTLSDPGITAWCPLCIPCASEVLKEVAYRFRENIPASELPDEVTRRPDCCWGRNCCRQVWSQPHAQRLNHVCEQSRLKI